MDYKDKLKLAKEALDSGSYDKETIEYIFPELAESEDERIRKKLITYFQDLKGGWFENITNDDIITWLEKQGKPKWSERDDKNLAITIGYLQGFPDDLCEMNALIKWLKGLKERIK